MPDHSFVRSFRLVSSAESCFTQGHALSWHSLHFTADGIGVIKPLPVILMRANFGRKCFIPELTMGLAKADVG